MQSEKKSENKREKSFVEQLRAELNQYRGLTDSFLMNLPDYVQLLSNLLDLDFLDSEDRRDICTALGYFIAPADLIPEEIYGPQGYVDDIYLTAFVIHGLLAKHGEGRVEPYWEGEESLKDSLEYTLEKAGAELEAKNLREAVLSYVGIL